MGAVYLEDGREGGREHGILAGNGREHNPIFRVTAILL